MYLCASFNVPHTDGVIIRAGDELSPSGGAQRHGPDGTSVGAYQRAVAPATCVQEPNVTLQSENHVYPRSKPLKTKSVISRRRKGLGQVSHSTKRGGFYAVAPAIIRLWFGSLNWFLRGLLVHPH